jgi:hypothetical protein
MLLAFQVLTFGLTCWLGLYLISRDLASPRLRFAGLGLAAYALGWASEILRANAPPALALPIARFSWPLFLLPALFWTIASVYLLPEDHPLRPRLVRFWAAGVVPGATLCYLINLPTGFFFDTSSSTVTGWPGAAILALVALAPLLAVVVLLWRAARALRPQNARGVLLVSLLFFALSTSLFLLPNDWLPRLWVLLAIGSDLVFLGLAMAALDVFQQGEAWLPDLLRSFTVSLGAAALFGSEVALVLILAPNLSASLLPLLLAIITSAIAIQVFANPLTTLLDKIAFSNIPRLRQARADLRAVADALPRVNPALDLEALDDAGFIRLTRRALSSFGDLARLAGSPLTRLPQIEVRLAARGAKTDPLERAIELKAVLAESVARLKPAGKDDFGTSDEWRQYNALYFPYIVGLKPYSRRAQHAFADPTTRAALDWFRVYVPERTLHHWQTAATILIAHDLRSSAPH